MANAPFYLSPIFLLLLAFALYYDRGGGRWLGRWLLESHFFYRLALAVAAVWALLVLALTLSNNWPGHAPANYFDQFNCGPNPCPTPSWDSIIMVLAVAFAPELGCELINAPCGGLPESALEP